MYLHFFNSFLVFMIVGLVGEAVVIAEVFRLLIPPLFLSPDNTSQRPMKNTAEPPYFFHGEDKQDVRN